MTGNDTSFVKKIVVTASASVLGAVASYFIVDKVVKVIWPPRPDPSIPQLIAELTQGGRAREPAKPVAEPVPLPAPVPPLAHPAPAAPLPASPAAPLGNNDDWLKEVGDAGVAWRREHTPATCKGALDALDEIEVADRMRVLAAAQPTELEIAAKMAIDQFATDDLILHGARRWWTSADGSRQFRRKIPIYINGRDKVQLSKALTDAGFTVTGDEYKAALILDISGDGPVQLNEADTSTPQGVTPVVSVLHASARWVCGGDFDILPAVQGTSGSNAYQKKAAEADAINKFVAQFREVAAR